MADKVLIVAPFWGRNAHPGYYRVERFVRWLAKSGLKIVLVKAGNGDRVAEAPWGTEITIKDPLGLYPEVTKQGPGSAARRKPHRYRALAAQVLFNPDPSIVWARRAARHALVSEQRDGVGWILSSSPPESAHIAALILAKRWDKDLVADLRDGWLDEPLKPLLRKFGWQRWREGRLERRVLRRAGTIFVTSEIWRELLHRRLPWTRGKTVVLTNGYPGEELPRAAEDKTSSSPDRIILLHSGRFTGSSRLRKVRCLLEPLYHGLESLNRRAGIRLLGHLDPEDVVEVENWRRRLEARNCSIDVCASVPRLEALDRLNQSDGLLLLSMSEAAVPSKLFEYLVTGLPILAVTHRKSAVWEICESIPRVFLADHGDYQRDESIVRDYLRACASGRREFDLPDRFTDAHLSRIFLDETSPLPGRSG